LNSEPDQSLNNVGVSGGTMQKSSKYAELPVRIASAAVLGLFALYCTWSGGLTFLLLIIAACGLIFYEFSTMVKKALPRRVALFAAGFIGILFASYLVDRPLNGLVIMGIGALVLAAWEWIIGKSVWGATALIYAGLPFAALVGMRDGDAGFFVIVFVLACVWGADTLAYFSGKTFGGPKLAPSISPNKTWSGFFGGLLGALLLSAVVTYLAGYGPGGWMISLAVLLALASQVGDLFESWVKRHFGLKDSGKIIPGHGGMLDRIDGLIFAIIGAWLISLAMAPGVIGEADLPGVFTQSFFVKS